MVRQHNSSTIRSRLSDHMAIPNVLIIEAMKVNIFWVHSPLLL